MNVFSLFIEPRFVLLVLLGSLAGFLIGALPGLSVTMATALLVSITYAWETNDALALIMGIYVVGVFSGALSAILLNIPGAPSAVITTLDGYPLAKMGKSVRAIRIAALYSVIGAVIGFLFLWLLAKPMAHLALAFKPMDYFLLSLFGLLSIGVLTAKSSVKGWISATLGLFFSLIGMDSVAGYPRLTFGIRALRTGVGIVPALVGLFGFAQVIALLAEAKRERKAEEPRRVPQTNEERVSWKDLFRHWKMALLSVFVGTAVGILPGAGTPVASLTAYGLAKRFVKHPTRPFGTGAEEGIAASEAANNAVCGGALIPTLALGIPGDAVTAILLAVFTLHGLEPGPLFLERSQPAFSAILAAGLLSSVFLLPLGLWVAPRASGFLRMPKAVLAPLVAALCVFGAYGTEKRLSDIALMVFFGALGYLLKRRGFPTAPITLGLVLGGLMDSNFRRALSLASSAENQLLALFGRPITIFLLLAIGALLLSQAVKKKDVRAERKR